MSVKNSSLNDPPYDGKYGVRVLYSNRPEAYFWFKTESKRTNAYKKYLKHITDSASPVKGVEKKDREVS